MFVEEKNPTIVNFPLRGLDFKDCTRCAAFHKYGFQLKGTSRADLDAPSTQTSTLYDLIANVTHESAAGTTRDRESTVWKVHLRAGAGGGESEKWFQIQDLIVEEIRKEMIFLGETILQVSPPAAIHYWHLFTLHRYGNVEQKRMRRQEWILTQFSRRPSLLK